MGQLGDALQPGIKINEFEIIETLGRGGFGLTYKALDHNIGCLVAIKEYLPEDFAVRDANGRVGPSGQDKQQLYDTWLANFTEEAQTLSKLRHTAIVQVKQQLPDLNGTAYMVMEYLDGGNLDSFVKTHGPLSMESFRTVFSQLLDGCEKVHNAGILHRDIKPENIMMVGSDQPVLIDFGAARKAEIQQNKALTRVVADGYSPREQYTTSLRQDRYSDIYSLAATAYFSLTGTDPMSATERLSGDQLTSLEQIAPAGVPLDILRGIDWGLNIDISDRPADIASWRQQMPSLSETGTGTGTDPLPAPGLSRRQMVLGGVAAGGLVVAAGAGFVLSQPAPRPDLSGSARTLVANGRRELGTLAPGIPPQARIIATQRGAAIASYLGSNVNNASAMAMQIDRNLNTLGQVFRSPEPRSYGRIALPYGDGGLLLGGVADSRLDNRGNEVAKAYVARIDADGRQMWGRTYGDGLVNDIAIDPRNGNIVFGREDINLGEIAVVTRIDSEGRPIGEPLEMGRKSDESVERLAMAEDGTITVLNFQGRGVDKSGTVVNKFRLVDDEAQELWSAADANWLTDEGIIRSQPHAMVRAAGGIFYAGRAKPDTETYGVAPGAVASYIGRLSDETGLAEWRKVGPLGGEGPDPYCAIQSLALYGEGSPSLFAAEVFQQSLVSRISQLDGEGNVLSSLTLGSEQEPFSVRSITLDETGGFAIGSSPRPSSRELVVYRLEWG